MGIACFSFLLFTMATSYTTQFAVVYSAATDSFDFIFATYFSTISVPRVGFVWKPNLSLTNAMTLYSQPLYNNTVSNGITVAWPLCTAPVSSSAQDLYDNIVALYTGGGGGTVTSVTAGTGITMTGTATDPIVNNAGVLSVTAGTNVTLGGTAANPIINATGGGGGSVNSVTAGTGLTDTGTATDPVLNIADTGSGAGSTTLSSLTRNAQGQITSAANGTGAQINAALGYTAANAAAVVNSITAGTGIAVGGTATVPVVSNTGVISVTAGTNVTIGGTAANPIINASGGGGVASVTAGGHAVVTGTLTNPIVDVKTPLFAVLYAGGGSFTTGAGGAPASIYSHFEGGNIAFTSSSSGWQYTGTPTLSVEFEVSGIVQFQTGFSGPSSLAIGTCINGNPGGTGFETQTFNSVPNATTYNTTFSFFVRRFTVSLATNDVINIYATTLDSYWSLKEFVIRVREYAW